MNQEKIRSFTDLNCWKEGHKLVLMVYQITKIFPKDELFGLVNQIRRCTVSITSNIAEGFSRHTYKEKIQFARDVAYITKEDFKRIALQTVVVNKLINGLIKKSKTIIHDS